MPLTVRSVTCRSRTWGLLAPFSTRRGHSVRYVDVPVASLDDLDPPCTRLARRARWPDRRLPKRPLSVSEARDSRSLHGGVRRSPADARYMPRQPVDGDRARCARVPVRHQGDRLAADRRLRRRGRESCLRHLPTPVLHWHGDTFDLPEGCRAPRVDGGLQNQAFALGPTRSRCSSTPRRAGLALEAGSSATRARSRRHRI